MVAVSHLGTRLLPCTRDARAGILPDLFYNCVVFFKGHKPRYIAFALGAAHKKTFKVTINALHGS